MTDLLLTHQITYSLQCFKSRSGEQDMQFIEDVWKGHWHSPGKKMSSRELKSPFRSSIFSSKLQNASQDSRSSSRCAAIHSPPVFTSPRESQKISCSQGQNSSLTQN